MLRKINNFIDELFLVFAFFVLIIGFVISEFLKGKKSNNEENTPHW